MTLWKSCTLHTLSKNLKVFLNFTKWDKIFFSLSVIPLYLVIIRTASMRPAHLKQLQILLYDSMEKIYITHFLQKWWSFYTLRKTRQHIFLFLSPIGSHLFGYLRTAHHTKLIISFNELIKTFYITSLFQKLLSF